LIFALSPLFTLQKDKPYAILAGEYGNESAAYAAECEEL